VSLEKHTEDFFHEIFVACGENPLRQGLVKTPQRFFNSFMELTEGYRQNLDDIINDALFECSNTSPVYVKDIPYFSLCEHHLLPFFGQCQIAYTPKGYVLGLSKIYRIVNLFSKRLQLQERLTQQIGETLQKITQSRGVWIEMTGKHLCVAMRGVQQSQSFVKTSYKWGEFPEGFSLKEQNKEAILFALKLKTIDFPLKIGCYKEEQEKFTPVRITIELKMEPSKACFSDHLKDACCYDRMSRYLEKHCFQQSFQLIEHACQVIYEGVHSYLNECKVSPLVRVTLTKVLQHTLLMESQCTVSDF